MTRRLEGTTAHAMERALGERGYPTLRERDAFRDGFADGANWRERDEEYADHPNAYSAGYWEGFHHAQQEG